MVLSLCCCDLHIFRRQCVNAHVWELLANQKWGKGRPADVHPCVFNASSWSIQHGIAASAPLQRDGSINGSPNGPECNVAPATPTINDRDGYCASLNCHTLSPFFRMRIKTFLQWAHSLCLVHDQRHSGKQRWDTKENQDSAALFDFQFNIL